MAKLKTADLFRSTSGARLSVYWKPVSFSDGDQGRVLHIGFNPMPISIAKVVTDHGLRTEWHVYARGALVGVTDEWAKAEGVAFATLALMEASDG